VLLRFPVLCTVCNDLVFVALLVVNTSMLIGWKDNVCL